MLESPLSEQLALNDHLRLQRGVPVRLEDVVVDAADLEALVGGGVHAPKSGGCRAVPIVAEELHDEGRRRGRMAELLNHNI